MDYIIKFDNREKDLVKLLHEKGYHFDLENLELGDIQIVDPHSNEIIIIIERKTLSDLSASIKDNRYKEQKERLVHSLKSNVRKIMLIEGEKMSDFKLPAKTFDSVVVNTMLRDNIHIHISKNLEDTCKFMENIIIQIVKYYDDLRKEIITGEKAVFQEMASSCKMNKKDNITNDVCFRNMLAQIPGVSISIATVFVEKYGTMNNFLIELGKNGGKENIVKIIAEEKYGKNSRRIGDKVGEKIYNFLF